MLQIRAVVAAFARGIRRVGFVSYMRLLDAATDEDGEGWETADDDC